MSAPKHDVRTSLLTTTEARVAAVALIGFVLVAADVVVGGYLTHLDQQVRDAIQPRSTEAPWLITKLADLGDLQFAIPLVLIVAIVSAQSLWRWWPLMLGCGTLLVGELVVLAIKTVIGRDGPGVWAVRQDYPGYFPSGHTATAMLTVAVVIFTALTVFGARARADQVRLSRLAAAAGVVVGLESGIRALFADTHWMSDVVGGFLLGSAMLVLVLALGRALVARSRAVS